MDSHIHNTSLTNSINTSSSRKWRHPFLGSGTTMKVARELGRSSWGYEIDPRMEKTIKRKMATGDDHNSEIDFVFRKGPRKLRRSIRRSWQPSSHFGIGTIV